MLEPRRPIRMIRNPDPPTETQRIEKQYAKGLHRLALVGLILFWILIAGLLMLAIRWSS